MATYPELNGRNVLVTGGANGIGTEITRAFHEQGARVWLCDTDAARGKELARALGDRARFRRVDLRKEREIVEWVRGVEGGIHVLVNNAARDPRIRLEALTVRDWDELFAVNLRAFFLTIREAAPRMGAGASVVNLASITFHNAPAAMSAYVATKGGVLGMTRSLARELGPRRIRVNAVSPGWVMTERQLRMHVTPAVKRELRRAQSIPDLLQPRAIAEVVLFLGSDGSRAISGQEILADHGWHHS